MDANREQLLDQNYSATTEPAYKYKSLEENPEFWGNGIAELKHCIVIGSESDIAKGLYAHLENDGWSIAGWKRDDAIPAAKWNLVIIALGRVAPVGLWWQHDQSEWADTIASNLLLPIEILRQLWPNRAENSSVCFMAGSNPNKPMAGYAPYNAAKMALLKVCEQLDFETPDCKFFALAPGYVPTKIHAPTLEANWPNERIAAGGGTPIDKIYSALMWCVEQPKSVVGGRNICVSDLSDSLAAQLSADQKMFKLRRHDRR